MSFKSRAIIALVIVTAAIRCGDSFEEKNDRAVLEALRTDILEMIGQPSCNGDGDCRYIAFGSKPCGGPWEYLIYSSSATDSLRLAEKVAFYNDYEDMMNHKYNYVSDCEVPYPPDPGCVDGVCVDMSGHIDP